MNYFSWVLTFFQWIGKLFSKNKKCTCGCCGVQLSITDKSGKQINIVSDCAPIVIRGVNQNRYDVFVGNRIVLTFKPLDKKCIKGKLVKSLIPHKLQVKSFLEIK